MHNTGIAIWLVVTLGRVTTQLEHIGHLKYPELK